MEAYRNDLERNEDLFLSTKGRKVMPNSYDPNVGVINDENVERGINIRMDR